MMLRTVLTLLVFVSIAILAGVYYGAENSLYFLVDSKQSMETTHGLFSNTCECQSMFTIGQCSNDKISSLIKNWKSIKQKLNFLHHGGNIAANKLYLALSRYLKPSYKMINGDIPMRYRKFIKKIQEHKNLNNQTKKISSVSPSFLLDLDPLLPYVSCKHHVYHPTVAKKCISEFNRISGRQLKLAFLGDSTIRIYMQSLVKDFNQEFDFQFESSKYKFDINEDFLNNKVKHNIPLTGSGLELRLYWAPYIGRKSNSTHPFFQGAKDVIQRWVNNTEELDFPDVLLISYGMWNVAHTSGTTSVNEHYSGLTAVSPLLKQLSMKTKVIFHVIPPIKQWLLYENNTNSIGFLDYVNQMTFYKLSHSRIWMWDSFYPVALKDIKECKNYLYIQKKFNISTPKEWNCNDYMHIGDKTKKTSTNLLWNLICNKIMNLSKDSCCS